MSMAFPIITFPSTVVGLSDLMNLHVHIIVIQSLWFTLGLTLAAVHPMVLDKCVMTCFPIVVSQSVFTALKKSLTPFTHSFHFPAPWPWLSLILWLSAQFYLFWNVMVRLTQYGVFPDWLLSPSNVHLKFFMPLCGSVTHLFLAQYSTVDVPQFTHAPSKGHLGCRQVLAIRKKVMWTSMCDSHFLPTQEHDVYKGMFSFVRN
jgi:hypothetical protein